MSGRAVVPKWLLLHPTHTGQLAEVAWGKGTFIPFPQLTEKVFLLLPDFGFPLSPSTGCHWCTSWYTCKSVLAESQCWAFRHSHKAITELGLWKTTSTPIIFFEERWYKSKFWESAFKECNKKSGTPGSPQELTYDLWNRYNNHTYKYMGTFLTYSCSKVILSGY